MGFGNPVPSAGGLIGIAVFILCVGIGLGLLIFYFFLAP
jgi:hypothetical protein